MEPPSGSSLPWLAACGLGGASEEFCRQAESLGLGSVGDLVRVGRGWVPLPVGAA